MCNEALFPASFKAMNDARDRCATESICFKAVEPYTENGISGDTHLP